MLSLLTFWLVKARKIFCNAIFFWVLRTGLSSHLSNFKVILMVPSLPLVLALYKRSFTHSSMHFSNGLSIWKKENNVVYCKILFVNMMDYISFVFTVVVALSVQSKSTYFLIFPHFFIYLFFSNQNFLSIFFNVVPLFVFFQFNYIS
jgi:hypothetical protein